MSKLSDFYKQSETNGDLRKALESANNKYKGDANPDREKVYSEIISIAGNHGTTLSRGDFDAPKGELSDSELQTVAGGAGGCLISNAGCNVFGEIDKKGGCIIVGAYR
ncbi:MAG: hypothetical protein LBT44_05060 [Clostridiales bacterium]|jgi:hypothetical protein|nr:hypothetical protein [Clostridiales bacterium]